MGGRSAHATARVHTPHPTHGHPSRQSRHTTMFAKGATGRRMYGVTCVPWTTSPPGICSPGLPIGTAITGGPAHLQGWRSDHVKTPAHRSERRWTKARHRIYAARVQGPEKRAPCTNAFPSDSPESVSVGTKHVQAGCNRLPARVCDVQRELLLRRRCGRFARCTHPDGRLRVA